jgi:hypothetical protein
LQAGNLYAGLIAAIARSAKDSSGCLVHLKGSDEVNEEVSRSMVFFLIVVGLWS